MRTSTGPCTRGSEKQTSACNDWPSPTPVNTEEQQQTGETVERAAESQRGNRQGKTKHPITTCRKFIINPIPNKRWHQTKPATSQRAFLPPWAVPQWAAEHGGCSARGSSVTLPVPHAPWHPASRLLFFQAGVAQKPYSPSPDSRPAKGAIWSAWKAVWLPVPVRSMTRHGCQQNHTMHRSTFCSFFYFFIIPPKLKYRGTGKKSHNIVIKHLYSLLKVISTISL